jgi:hypothetical protein
MADVLYTLGPHSKTPSTDAMKRWARKAPFVKQCGGVDLLAIAPPGAITVFRDDRVPQEQQSVGDSVNEARALGIQYGEQIVSSLQGFKREGLYAECSRNEAYQKLGEQKFELHVEFMQAASDVLHSYGYRTIGPNNSWGSLDEPEWAYFKAHNYGGCDAIGTHCYGPHQWEKCDDWSLFRWRKVREWIGSERPIYLTEAGIDAVYGSKPGWKANGLNAEQYWNWIRKLDAVMVSDSVRGALFTGSIDNDLWRPFDIDPLEPKVGPWMGTLPVISKPEPKPEPPKEGKTVKIGNGLEVLDLRSVLARKGTYPTRQLGAIKRIVIHHSAADVDSSAGSIASYHVGTLGWPGIGYHFLVHWDGRIEYTMDMSLISYHVASLNAESVGICLPGDWTTKTPPEATLNAAHDLVANIQYALGWFVPVVGHRDIAQTECPGNTWAQWKERVIVRAPAPQVPSNEADWERKAKEYRETLDQIRTLAS